MKYVITGSLGNISKPLVTELVAAGHEVTVISSNPGKTADIEALPAKAAIGSLTDRNFLTTVFKNADAAYLMIPPNATVTDFFGYQKQVADNYLAALKQGQVKHIVALSSIGAHLGNNTGPIDGVAYLEKQLLQLNVAVKFLRPGYFFYNLFGMVGMLKQAGFVGSNFGSADEKIVFAHTADIAARAADHLKKLDFTGHSVEYIASDERYASDVATLLGKSVGKDNVQWITFTDEQALEGMLQAGIPPALAEAYATMGKAFREGGAQEDYWKNRPTMLGRHKLEDFVNEFAGVYGSVTEPALNN
jgi:uncharacterized protein YbjT (DUF2867 family)